MVVTAYTRNMKKSCSRNELLRLWTSKFGMWNLLIPGRRGVKGHQRVFFLGGGGGAEGKGQGGGLGVEFTTTPAWVLEP